MISLESKLDSEIRFMSEMLCHNSFPLSAVQTVIAYEITEFNKIEQASVQKFLFYLRLSWMGVELVKNLLNKSQKLYSGIIFHPTYVWFFTLSPF